MVTIHTSRKLKEEQSQEQYGHLKLLTHDHFSDLKFKDQKFIYYPLRQQWENHPGWSKYKIKDKIEKERLLFCLFWMSFHLHIYYLPLGQGGFLRTWDKDTILAPGKKKIAPWRHCPKAAGPKYKFPPKFWYT